MNTLVIIDINNFIYRAFYGIQENLTAPDGTPVNAVYGVATMIHRLLKLTNPTTVLVAKDSKTSIRKKIYSEYKANRQQMPADMVKQLPLIYEMIKLMNLPTIEVTDYEADDIIYSAVTKFYNHYDRIIIASGDKDLMQLVDEKVRCIDTMKNQEYGPTEVMTKFGVTPKQIIDQLALIGDKSDNVPGVTSIGNKTATKLITQYGTLANIYLNIESLPDGTMKSNLISQEANARVSYELIKLIQVEIPDSFVNYDPTPSMELFSFFGNLRMNSLIERLKNKT